jgi:Transglutaminase-like superfamily
VIALCRRFTSLDPADRRLLLEAASWMALVWTGLRLLRFPTLRHILDDYASGAATDAGPHPNAMSRIPWAIAAAANRFPWATCLVQALAADVLLRRAGLTCELRIGVRVSSNRSQPLEAHAWIECDGAVAIGAIEDLSDFKVLAPARSS